MRAGANVSTAIPRVLPPSQVTGRAVSTSRARRSAYVPWKSAISAPVDRRE